MIHSLQIQGYRSLEDFRLKLAPLTVVQGENGVGKSNLYKALGLFSSLIKGTFPQAIAAEGGTQSCLWAGPMRRPKKRKEVSLNLKATDYEWKITFGLIPNSPTDPTIFKGDPDLKKESLTLSHETLNRRAWSGSLPHNESLLSFVRDPSTQAELALIRDDILSWRFFGDFRHDPLSPLRQPASCAWSPILSETGDNLPAVLQTIRESGSQPELDAAIQSAFPDHRLQIHLVGSTLELLWHQPGLSRPVNGTEISDGTLQFLVLAAALLSPRAPSLLVLNEPEDSLNPTLYAALASLIHQANRSSQIIVITHSSQLSDALTADSEAIVHRLAIQDGATRLVEDLGPRKVWHFDD